MTGRGAFGPQQDVVVRFDEHAFKLVFWHGINHYPVWYAENDIGLMWEAVETSGPLGCHEAMMDRQCRYSHVRIIESNDARVRIHWRHALCNIEYGLVHVDPVSGWGDWCDEYLTIYPDGVAARELVHWCSRPNSRHTYEQDNFIIPIGMTPAEVLDKEAITLANLDGDESKLDWAETGTARGQKHRKCLDPQIQHQGHRQAFHDSSSGDGEGGDRGQWQTLAALFLLVEPLAGIGDPLRRQTDLHGGRPAIEHLGVGQHLHHQPRAERTHGELAQADSGC
jgi:hypothetical protein